MTPRESLDRVRVALSLRSARTLGDPTPSLAAQHECLQQLATARGRAVVAVYKDRTGAPGYEPCGLRDTLLAAERGEYEVVLVPSADRLSRSRGSKRRHAVEERWHQLITR